MATPPFKPHWFGNHELLQVLGVGGMAEVFLARTMGAQGFEKVMVIKRLLRRLTSNQRIVQMFIDEAKVTVRLQHANIVQIFDFDEFQDRPFIVMEYVHGKDLLNVLRRAHKLGRNLPLDFGIHCIIEMLKGLGYAHTATGPDGLPLNLVHRDVTPSNVFVSYDGEVKLGDFGVAHSLNAVGATEVRGKFNYLAPELLRGEDLDARADLFSAGVVLWETLAQRRLFIGKNEGDVLRQIRERVPEPPSKHNRRVPPELDRLTAKALDKDPRRRFATAQDFEDALADFLFARRLRWTRRRIAEVMVSHFPDEGVPLVLPEPSPRPSDSQPMEVIEVEIERDEDEPITAVDSQPLAWAVESMPGAGRSSDSGLEREDRTDVMGPSETPHPGFSLFSGDAVDPLHVNTEELVAAVVEAPAAYRALGVWGAEPLVMGELGQLLFWDGLVGLHEPPERPMITATFDDVSLPRLLYETSTNRTTGLVVIESGDQRVHRMLYLDAGEPLYIASDDISDGALVLIERERLVDAEIVDAAISAVIERRLPLDQALMLQRHNGAEQVEGIFTTLFRRRLHPAFAWTDGRFRVYAGVRPPLWPSVHIPELPGLLARAVQRAVSLEELRARFVRSQQRPLFLAPDWEDRVAALRLDPQGERVVAAIDGRRDLTAVLDQAEAHTEGSQLAALVVIYLLVETRAAEFGV